jgi:hypothetical protein
VEVPILPDDTSLWGFTLTTYFWNALPDELQSHISDNQSYAHPDASTLTSKTIQLDALRQPLRGAAVKAAKETSITTTGLLG